jgi:Ran GTPase-activating protein (RanGAP) involved in mRNA processing and transport
MTGCGVSDLLLDQLSQGIKMCHTLADIDLSNNMFEPEHTVSLIDALIQTWACERLTLSGLKIEENQAKHMALFFGDSRCRLKNLSLNEIEFDK